MIRTFSEEGLQTSFEQMLENKTPETRPQATAIFSMAQQASSEINDSILDQVHFVRSHESFGVQLADLCAYVVNLDLQQREYLNTFSKVESRLGIPIVNMFAE